jgi:hypothetical protein
VPAARVAPAGVLGEHRVVTGKSPAERALDLFVYAPLGLALSARDLLPDLVEKGRNQLTGQVSSARFVGQFAVKQGSKQANKAFERARASAEATLAERLESAGVETGARNGTAADGARPPATPPRPTPAAAHVAPTEVRPEPTTVRPTPTRAASPTPAAAGPAPSPEPVRAEPATPGAPAPLADTLAIPAYDSLSASQVVPRLSSLSPSELEAVREYETAHRGRKTILNRVAQLSS